MAVHTDLGHEDLIRAVDLALAGDTEAAAAIITDGETGKTACWIRACLHKAGGDAAAARAWYARSSQFYESFADARTEFQAIKAALTY
jgi:hypothetical protein